MKNEIKLTPMTLMAMQYLNAPYGWAGNGPYIFDCSGFVLKVLHDVGITLPDMTSQDIHTWHRKRVDQASIPRQDCLLYYGKDHEHITHIAIAINESWIIEAGGAGPETAERSFTELLSFTKKKDARVRIKPMSHRRDMVDCLYLDY